MASPKILKTANKAGRNKLALNLVVCLQLVSLPAFAADEAKSDKANWIKQNLAAMTASESKPTKAKASKNIQSNMMPFVANRHLPTKLELEQHLMAEQARFDDSVGTRTVLQNQTAKFDNLPLNGTVSAYGTPVAQPAPVSVRETRAWQDEAASALKRIASNHGKVSHKHQRSAPTMARACPIVPDTASLQQNNQAIRQTGALLIESPMLTPNERTMLDGVNQMGGSAEQSSDSAQSLLNTDNSAAPTSEFGAAGPPPFPLNLIPAQVLHDMIARGHHQKINAPQAFFGSWHGASAQNLPAGGFRSNLGQAKHSAQHFAMYAPTAGNFGRSFINHGSHKVVSRLQQTQPVLLTYPSYSRVDMF